MFHLTGSPVELSRELISTGENKIWQLSGVYFRNFSMFFLSYRALAVDITNLIISAPVTLEGKVKVPIFAIFGVFQAIRFGIRL